MVPDASGAVEFPGRNHRARYFLSLAGRMGIMRLLPLAQAEPRGRRP